MATSQPPGLIDTDILVDSQHGITDAVNFVASQHSATGVRISIVAAMELSIGAQNSSELAIIRQFLRQVTILPITATISVAAHQLVDKYFLSHGLLIPDAFIAATALEHQLPLYTRNLKHFQMISGLQAVAPY